MRGCVSASSEESFKRVVCYPRPLCFNHGCPISKDCVLCKKKKKKLSCGGLHLNFLELKITFLLINAPWSHAERKALESRGRGEAEGGSGGGRGQRWRGQAAPPAWFCCVYTPALNSFLPRAFTEQKKINDTMRLK